MNLTEMQRDDAVISSTLESLTKSEGSRVANFGTSRKAYEKPLMNFMLSLLNYLCIQFPLGKIMNVKNPSAFCIDRAGNVIHWGEIASEGALS